MEAWSGDDGRPVATMVMRIGRAVLRRLPLPAQNALRRVRRLVADRGVAGASVTVTKSAVHRLPEPAQRELRRGREMIAGARPARRSRRGHATALRRRIQMIAEPGAPVLLASRGDDRLVDLGSHPCWHFPEHRDGGWAGFDPVDGPAAVTHLEAQRARGARYFVLPATVFDWQTRYPELFRHLESIGRRVHHDDQLLIFDLVPDIDTVELEPLARSRVHVVGSLTAPQTHPPAGVVDELASSTGLDVTQEWAVRPPGDRGPVPDDPAIDYVVFVDENAVLPSGFLDALIATQATLDVDRVQPSHTSGPSSAPPVTERHRGVVAREVGAPTPLPVLSVRRDCSPDGPVVLADEVTVGLREPISTVPWSADAHSDVRRLWTLDTDRRPVSHVRSEPVTQPRISVLISTFNRRELLRGCIESFVDQSLDRAEYEVVVVDDGSDDSAVAEILDEFADRLQIVAVRVGHGGRSAAKNHAVMLARAPVIVFFDDDDRATPDYLRRHLEAHGRSPDEGVAILGHTEWAPELEISPLMHFVTDVDRSMFSYASLVDGQELDWRGFWEGRISCKRSLLIRHGFHDQRLDYSIDIELGWRLMDHGLRVIYDAAAVSVMARPLAVDAFCDRTQAKGRAVAVIAALHPGTGISRQLSLDDTVGHFRRHRFDEEALRLRIAALEDRCESDDDVAALHDAYRRLFRLLHAKGVAEATAGVHAMPRQPTTVQPFDGTDPPLVHDGTPAGAPSEPVLSITLPVWSRTPQLAEMAAATIERIWEVARVPTEIVVVDNGSEHEIPLAAKVYRYPQNRGVATGWNTGIRLSTAATFVVMNSDCRVEPGWDEALYEAANDGRRVAFPYTDHCDGRGFTRPDQGGTAGWCFMMSRAVHDEVGVFDEWFDPAFCEDTDYWHRAWQLGIELTPVPAARVVHARRTTASTHPHVEWLLQGHRYKYGWKHGVDPHAAPPYYNRTITEYHGSFDAGS